MRKLLPIILAIFVGYFTIEKATAQATLIQEAPVTNGATTGARAPNGTSGHAFMRASTIVPSTELTSIPNGTTLTTLGFTYTTAASIPVVGNIKIYLMNTTDATYTRGTDWNTIITGMTLVYDGAMVVPNATGPMDLTLTTPFVYTGAGLNVAYDFNSAGPYASGTGAAYAASNVMAASLVSGASATAAPTAITSSTAFRPSFRFGYANPYANDIAVDKVFTLGEMPLLLTTSHDVMAIVRNGGSATQTNVIVTLSVTGANTYTAIDTILTLAAGASDTITFTGFMPTTLGVNDVTVSVSADENNTNNSDSYRQEITCDSYAYADTSTDISGLGFGNSTGLMLTKYTIQPGEEATVEAVDVHIAPDAATIGKTIYAVVLNSAGTIIGQSANFVPTAADINSIHRFVITTPPTITGDVAGADFYVGLAQTQGATPATYYPLGVQAETFNYPGAYQIAGLTGGALTPLSGYGRWIIKAIVNTTESITLASSDADSLICANEMVTFLATSGYSNYKFMINGVSMQDSTINSFMAMNLNNGDIFTVSTVCNLTSNELPFTVIAPVSAGIDSASNVCNTVTLVDLMTLIGGNPDASGTFVDDSTGSTVSNSFNPSTEGPGIYSFTYTVTATAPCSDSSSTVVLTVDNCTGIQTLNSASFNVYPNPNNGIFVIEADMKETVKIEVTNVLGQVVYLENVNNSSSKKQLDLSNLPTGVYSVKLSSLNKNLVKSVVIK